MPSVIRAVAGSLFARVNWLRFLLNRHSVRSAFICGCGHTGTSILLRILATHPLVNGVPFETKAFLGQDRWRALAKMYVQARQVGLPLLLEKTPRHIHKMELIRRTVPGAKFILTVRDGRDVAASLGKRLAGDYRAAADRWISDTAIVASNVGRSDCLLFRYEDFVAEPARSIEAVCAFLHIDYEPSMLDYHTVWQPRLKSRGGFDLLRREDGNFSQSTSAHLELRERQINSPIFDGRGRWRQDLPADVLDYLVVGPGKELMVLFGYGP